MRRSLRVIALAALLAGSVGFVPAVSGGGDDVVVCVTFRDAVVPGTGITVQRPTERVCVKTPTAGTPLGQR